LGGQYITQSFALARRSAKVRVRPMLSMQETEQATGMGHDALLPREPRWKASHQSGRQSSPEFLQFGDRVCRLDRSHVAATSLEV